LENWEALYRLACPQNFMFPRLKLSSILFSKPDVMFRLTEPYIFLLLLFLVNISSNERFQRNKKAIVLCLTAFGLLIFTFIFTHIHPIRFVLDLNSIRNTQFLSYILMGFTTVLIFDICRQRSLIEALIFTLLFACIKFGSMVAACALILMIALGYLNRMKGAGIKTFLLIITASASYGIVHAFRVTPFPYLILLMFIIIVLLCIAAYTVLSLSKNNPKIYDLRRYFIIVPLAIFLVHFINYRAMRIREETYGASYWSLHRSYEDMQRFVKANTDKDALLLVPHNMEMENFRTFSERKIIASYRDCGIIGFDYKAALEWRRRMNDIGSFKVVLTESPMEAVKLAVLKYRADYIVFMRYAAPADSSVLKMIYYNKDFALYKVVKD
jgi:hypothetical protein